MSSYEKFDLFISSERHNFTNQIITDQESFFVDPVGNKMGNLFLLDGVGR